MLLQQLAQSQPQLAQLIAQNPEALADLLAGGGGGGGGGAPQGGQGGGGGGGPRSHTVQITMEEKAQLDRLEALGFSRQRALEAWLLCDRNEELAANFLFENAGDDAQGQ
jgi:UV excision repair protein RAD23